MSTFNLSFSPSAFAKAAKQHKLFIRSGTDADRARIPTQLLQIKRLAGAYSIHLFTKNIDEDHDRIMGNIMWNDLIDHNTRTLCGDIGSKEVPLFSHIEASLVGIAALDRPFMEFYRRVSNSPWNAEGGAKPTKTLSTTTIGTFQRDLADLYDLYKSLSLSLFSRLKGYIISVSGQSLQRRLRAKIDDGFISEEQATAQQARHAQSFNPSAVDDVKSRARIDRIRKLIKAGADDRKIQKYLEEHDAQLQAAQPLSAPSTSVQDRVTSMQTDDARTNGVFVGCLDRYHIREGSLAAGEPVLVESWKCHIAIDYAPSWVRHFLKKMGSRLAKDGTLEELMLVISQLCMIRENAVLAPLTPHASNGDFKRNKPRRNKNGRNSDPSTSQISRAEAKYGNDSATPTDDRPAKPYYNAQWDKVLSMWRPPIPDADWDKYIRLSASAKRAYVASLPNPASSKPSTTKPAARPHVPYSTPYQKSKGQAASKKAKPTRLPSHSMKLRTGRFGTGGNDSRGPRTSKPLGLSSSSRPRSDKKVFTPGDHQVLTAIAEDYVTDDEADPEDTIAALTQEHQGRAMSAGTPPPPRPKNGRGEE